VIAYHGIDAEDVDAVLAEGLLVAKTGLARERRFWHLSFAETPGIARHHGTVVKVDLAGLDLPAEGFVGGELRLHEDVTPERLELLVPQPEVDRTGFLDPAKDGRTNHPTCLRLRCWEHPPQRR
jgi:hypothetical protein